LSDDNVQVNTAKPIDAPRDERRGPSPEERALATLAGNGDLEAFGQLIERYSDQARRVARGILGDHHDGDDAAQDAFLSALRHLDRYDSARPFGPWLMRIVSNAAVDRLRRKKVRAADQLSPGTMSRDADPSVDTDRRSLMTALGLALKDLPPRQRQAVVMFDVEGYSHAEIAETMSVPQGTVRSDVFHGRRALRRALRPWHQWKEETQ
jgi:RNA polymerase sigma-70 factor, ECF subfamily